MSDEWNNYLPLWRKYLSIACCVFLKTIMPMLQPTSCKIKTLVYCIIYKPATGYKVCWVECSSLLVHTFFNLLGRTWWNGQQYSSVLLSLLLYYFWLFRWNWWSPLRINGFQNIRTNERRDEMKEFWKYRAGKAICLLLVVLMAFTDHLMLVKTLSILRLLVFQNVARRSWEIGYFILGSSSMEIIKQRFTI